jgi:hypothetical protein
MVRYVIIVRPNRYPAVGESELHNHVDPAPVDGASAFSTAYDIAVGRAVTIAAK